jgi:hypothetical protein
MRAAPPLSVRCHGGWLWRALRAAFPALAAGVLVLWIGQHLAQSDWALEGRAFGLAWLGAAGVTAAPILLATALALCVAALAWRRTGDNTDQNTKDGKARELRWDGQTWSVDGVPGHLAVMVDLGPWLLLRWWPLPAAAALAAPSRWLAVAQIAVGANWHPLRAALYSRRPSAATSGKPELHPRAERNADGQS